jgi:curved DNA-binding protein CbpA
VTRSARNLYDVLNVSSGAEPVVIEAAYRALMKRYHPDQAGPGEASAANAAEINEAFAVLRSAERRAEYDRRERAIQQQAIRVAIQPAAPPPAARGGSLFAWSGWIVAMIVGVGFAMLATRPGGLAASVSRADAARVADLAPANRRSQPPERPVAAQSAMELAIESLGRTSPPPVAMPVDEALPERAIDAPAPAAVQLRAREAPRVRAERKRPAGRTAKKGKEADFLEREGYIY